MCVISSMLHALVCLISPIFHFILLIFHSIFCPLCASPHEESGALVNNAPLTLERAPFHLELHFMGELSGQVHLDWSQQQGYGVCSVCNRVLSSHFNGLHPRCFRASQRRRLRPHPLSVDPSSMEHLVCPMSPNLTGGSVLRYPRVPETFGVSAFHALASVASHREERSWVHLLTMLALTRRTLPRLSTPRSHG